MFAYDRDKQSSIRAKLSYDSLYKRVRRIEEFQLGKDDDFFDILELFNSNVRYTFNLKTKECKKEAITRPFREF